MRIEDLTRRAEDLIQEGTAVLGTRRPMPSLPGESVDFARFRAFRSATLSFLERTFGSSHPYCREFECVVKTNSASNTKAGLEILTAVKKELVGGWLFNLKGAVAGEIFADFTGLAKRALDENKDVAAVLVCAALEDALKRVGMQEGLDVEDKDMPEVINGLKAHGTIKGPQVAIAKGYIRLRNKAFHAQWNQIEKPEVSSAIGFTEQFLLEDFG